MVTDLNGMLTAVESLALPTAMAQFSQKKTILEALDIGATMAQIAATMASLGDRISQLASQNIQNQRANNQNADAHGWIKQKEILESRAIQNLGNLKDAK